MQYTYCSSTANPILKGRLNFKEINNFGSKNTSWRCTEIRIDFNPLHYYHYCSWIGLN